MLLFYHSLKITMMLHTRAIYHNPYKRYISTQMCKVEQVYKEQHMMLREII